MDFRVEITDPAIDDLAEIVSYIAQDNPDAARALGNHLLDAALSLEQAPQGREGRKGSGKAERGQG
jgi:plasmid stabilization system protein ParE